MPTDATVLLQQPEIALPDYAKLKWNETDLVKMIVFRTQIYKKIVRYVLRAYHQAVLDFFMSGGRKQIIIDGLGTFSMSNGLIIMRPSVKPGQKCRRAITTRLSLQGVSLKKLPKGDGRSKTNPKK